MNIKKILVFTLLTCSLLMSCATVSEASTKVTVKVGSRSFRGIFYNNSTAKALLKKMPLKVRMSELNGNEKYRYLKNDLPTDEKEVTRIKAGDIMLYGSDCLVFFYRSFNTTYEYTRVGRITDTKGLRKAAGKGSVTVRFSKRKVIHLTKTKLDLEPGDVKTIRLMYSKASKVKWMTSDRTVASVSKGRIKAKKAGTATVTARYKGKKYRCRVTVKAKEAEPQQEEEKRLSLKIGDTKVDVDWLDNESVSALKDLVKDTPLTIQMSMYGGFEQVGRIGTSLPRSDVQQTTSAGDIVLYSGDQMVVFYGSNSWAYTKLGKITGKTDEELRELLGNGNVTITVSME